MVRPGFIKLRINRIKDKDHSLLQYLDIGAEATLTEFVRQERKPARSSDSQRMRPQIPYLEK